MADFNVGDGGQFTIGQGQTLNFFDDVDSNNYAADSSRAWFISVVPDPHELGSMGTIRYPESEWLQVTSQGCGLWTDQTHPTTQGTLSRVWSIKNTGSTDAAGHMVLAVST
jgi:hypothetical protein